MSIHCDIVLAHTLTKIANGLLLSSGTMEKYSKIIRNGKYQINKTSISLGEINKIRVMLQELIIVMKGLIQTPNYDLTIFLVKP